MKNDFPLSSVITVFLLCWCLYVVSLFLLCFILPLVCGQGRPHGGAVLGAGYLRAGWLCQYPRPANQWVSTEPEHSGRKEVGGGSANVPSLCEAVMSDFVCCVENFIILFTFVSSHCFTCLITIRYSVHACMSAVVCVVSYWTVICLHLLELVSQMTLRLKVLTGQYTGP